MLPKTWSCCLLKISKIISRMLIEFQLRTRQHANYAVAINMKASFKYSHGLSLWGYFYGKFLTDFLRHVKSLKLCKDIRDSLVYSKIFIALSKLNFLSQESLEFQWIGNRKSKSHFKWTGYRRKKEKRQSIPYQVMQSLHSVLFWIWEKKGEKILIKARFRVRWILFSETSYFGRFLLKYQSLSVFVPNGQPHTVEFFDPFICAQEKPEKSQIMSMQPFPKFI